jgi:hypothetical protein
MDISKEKLVEILKYAEQKEEAIDSEWGACQSAKELINTGQLPEWYYDIRAKLFPDEDTVNMNIITNE